MAERPRLTLVERALQENPEDEKLVVPVRKVLTKHAPTISRLARSEERAELAMLGARALGESDMLKALRAERDARPTAEQMKEHGKHRFHQGVGMGALAGAAAAVAIGAALVPMLTQSTVSGVAVGSQIQRQSDNVRALEALDGQ